MSAGNFGGRAAAQGVRDIKSAARLLNIADKSAAVRAAAGAVRAEKRAKALQHARNMPKRAAMMQVPRGFTGVAGEAKYIDIANATYTLNTTGQIIHASVIPQGTTVNSRVGRKCELKYFQMRGQVEANSTATFNQWSIYLVWDEQPNKALAAVTDILDAATSYALSKRENVQRFKILRKWTGVLLGNTTTPATGKETERLDEYVRLPKGLVVVPTTADTTGVIGDVITGALLLVFVGDSAAGNTAASCVMTARTGFSDVY